VIDRVIAELAEKGWCVLPGFLPGELVRQLAQEAATLEQSGLMRPAATGQGGQREIRSSLRGDNIAWLDESPVTPAQGEFLARMEELRLAANRELQLGLFDLEAHFARYPAGARYGRHLDVFQRDSRRTLTIICYLNENWLPEHGGQLRMDLENGRQFEVLPEGGTLVCFLSHRFAHEVLPATRSRLSLTGWFRRRSS
jgi:SM-20-related protein